VEEDFFCREDVSDLALNTARKVCRMVYGHIDDIKGSDAEKAIAVMASLGQLLGASYMKVCKDYGPKASDDWLTRLFAVAQATIVANDGPQVEFSFLRKEE